MLWTTFWSYSVESLLSAGPIKSSLYNKGTQRVTEESDKILEQVLLWKYYIPREIRKGNILGTNLRYQSLVKREKTNQEYSYKI